MENTRLCRDCRHASRGDDGRTLLRYGACRHPRSKHQPPTNPVTGEQLQPCYHDMGSQRLFERSVSESAGEKFCGLEGAWWEPLFAHPVAQVAWEKEAAS